MDYNYKPVGVCSNNISFTIKDGKVYNVKFTYGCDGNAKGISRLCEGMEVNEVIKRLEGIECGWKPTSCPDQLSRALKKVSEEMNK